MSSALLSIVLTAGLAAPLDEGAVELRYTGSLDKVSKQADGTAVKRFSLFCLLSGTAKERTLAFVLDERGGGGWAWPERFGRMVVTAEKARPIRLLHDHQGTPVVVTLPCPVFAAWDKLKPGATWTEGRETWEVKGTQPVLERKCWMIDVSTGFGRKRTLWVDQELPVVAALEEKVFIGQGEEHTLKMTLSSHKVLSAEDTDRFEKPLAGLLALQEALKREENDTRAEFTPEQIKATAAAIGDLEKSAADTPFSALVTAVSRDLKSQQSRTGEVARLAGKFVGQNAAAFSLTTLDKKTLDDGSRKDRITVLHFWEYQNEPLVEPYGQSGYLDHLYSKRRKLGVDVIGVAVDSRLADPATQSSAVRSVQKFKSFMNLSYPIATDDGTVIGKFGDPRKAGAKLPLWVVIDGRGKILHYSVGFYKVNPDEGLRELDEVLVKAIRTARGKAE